MLIVSLALNVVLVAVLWRLALRVVPAAWEAFKNELNFRREFGVVCVALAAIALIIGGCAAVAMRLGL